MTVISDRSLIEVQRAVQSLMGYCILSLQEYELKLKGFLTESETVVTTAPDGTLQVEQRPDLAYTTLGGLVAQLLESVITGHEKAEAETPDDPSGKANSFKMRYRLSFEEKDLVQTASDLKEHVLMRNKLVHHFLVEHDLSSLAGCLAAEDALSKVADQINVHCDRLFEWMNERIQMKAQMLEFLGRPEIHDHLVHRRPAWRYTVIVKALQEAAETLHHDGWTSVSEAQGWMSTHYPEERPKGYNCQSWRKVILDCGLFELRDSGEGKTRASWYRPRPPATPRA